MTAFRPSPYRRRVLDAALVPELVDAAGDSKLGAGADVAIEASDVTLVGGDPLAAGDLLLVVQMQGATIDTYAIVTQVFKNIALANVATSKRPSAAPPPPSRRGTRRR